MSRRCPRTPMMFGSQLGDRVCEPRKPQTRSDGVTNSTFLVSSRIWSSSISRAYVSIRQDRMGIIGPAGRSKAEGQRLGLPQGRGGLKPPTSLWRPRGAGNLCQFERAVVSACAVEPSRRDGCPSGGGLARCGRTPGDCDGADNQHQRPQPSTHHGPARYLRRSHPGRFRTSWAFHVQA